MLVKDRLKGMTLQEALSKAKTLETVDPNEDLNVVDEETLRRKKAAMNETFEKNQKRPGDPDFQYEVEMDFDNDDKIEVCEWDSDSESDGGF